MTVLVSTIIQNVRVLLNDAEDGGITWTTAELLAWLNEATAEIVRIAPHANTKSIDHTLQVGSWQRLPDDGVQLIDIACNAPAGRSIRIIDQLIMDTECPDWRQRPTTSVTQRYMFDARDPRSFSVFPPSAGNAVRLIYAAVPSLVTAENQSLPLPAIYAAPVTNYICYRAWMKLVDNPASLRRAEGYKAIFDGQMGVKKQAEAESNPNVKLPVT